MDLLNNSFRNSLTMSRNLSIDQLQFEQMLNNSFHQINFGENSSNTKNTMHIKEKRDSVDCQNPPQIEKQLDQKSNPDDKFTCEQKNNKCYTEKQCCGVQRSESESSITVEQKKTLTHEEYKLNGNKAYHKRNYQRAVLLYTKAIKMATNYKDQHHDQQQNEVETEPEQSNVHHLSIIPTAVAPETLATYYSNRAAAHAMILKHEEAICDYNQAISVDPCFMNAYLRKAKILVSLEEYESAILTLKQALKICMNHPVQKIHSRRSSLNHTSSSTTTSTISPSELERQIREKMKEANILLLLQTSKTNPIDLYELLGISSSRSTTTSTEIKKAYRKCAMLYHPDKHLNSPKDVQKEAAKVFRGLQFAYEILSDELKKKRYDDGLEEYKYRDIYG